MKLLVSALEHSANVHLNALKSELDPDIEFMGIFDQELGDPLIDLRSLAIMGIVDALKKLSVSKAIENLKTEKPDITEEEIQKIIGECVFVSEAFFPFADSIEAASEMGAKFIVQPGGSIRDDEVVTACNKAGIAMALTGMRHFKH